MLLGSLPITLTSLSAKAHQKSGPSAPPALPGLNARTTLSDSRLGRRLLRVEAATLAQDRSPPITRTTFPTCRAHYLGGSSGYSCRLLPRSCSLPQMAGGSASALSLSRPAQASLTLPPAGSLSRPRRPLSRGTGPSGYPAEPLVSYQINRQFSGWLLPPQVIRAFRAHCQLRTCWREPSKIDALVYDDCISGTAANTVEISSRSSLLIRKLKGQRDLQQPGAVAGLTSDVIVIGV